MLPSLELPGNGVHRGRCQRVFAVGEMLLLKGQEH
jgi:hypothetical protein